MNSGTLRFILTDVSKPLYLRLLGIGVPFGPFDKIQWRFFIPNDFRFEFDCIAVEWADGIIQVLPKPLGQTLFTLVGKAITFTILVGWLASPMHGCQSQFLFQNGANAASQSAEPTFVYFEMISLLEVSGLTDIDQSI